MTKDLQELTDKIHTPDTEWEKKFDGRFGDTFRLCCDDETLSPVIKDYIHSLLTARDTYWKERAEEAYEWGVKQTIAQFLRMNIENPKAPVNVDEVKRRALNERV